MTKRNQKTDLLFILGLFAVQLVFFVSLSLSRFVAADEAFYAIAIKKVLSGSLIYRDFFYPQMPLFPYLYGLWMKCTGIGWEQGRILSGILAAATGTLVCFRIRGILNRKAACVVMLLYLFSGLGIAWYSTFKTYIAPSFFLTAAYLLLVRAAHAKRRTDFLLCGLLIGLAVNIRLYLAVVCIIPLVYISRGNESGSLKWKHACSYILGGFLTCLPHLYLMRESFDQHWFNNLGYHFIRSNLAGGTVYRQKWEIFLELLGLRVSEEVFGWQFLGLSILFFTYFAFNIIKRRKADPAFYFGLLLLAVNFVPTPAWLQYFSVCIPFFVIVAGLAVRDIFNMPIVRGDRFFEVSAKLLAVLAVFYYIWIGSLELHRYTCTGKGVIGVNEKNLLASRIGTISTVSEELNKLTQPGEYVISQWPGYLLESHAAILPGMENQFWVRVDDKLSEQDIKRYHLFSMRKLRTEIKEGDSRFLILGRRKKAIKKLNLEKYGFISRVSLPGVTIYSR